MVDEIIIHDVDVSGCKYLPYCEDKQGNCGNNPDCYFKQLARKTAECEKFNKRQNILVEGYIKRLKEWYNYKQILNGIENIIKDLENKNILTFPDLSKEENYNMIMKQCNSGYVQILNIIAKAKGN